MANWTIPANLPPWKLDKYRKAQEWITLNQSCVKGAVVFAGSSLMEMFPVEQFAREEGADFPTVYNRGLGGWRTDDMLPMLDTLVTDLQPRRVFINIGTNDLSDPTVTIADLISRYEQILNIILAGVPGAAGRAPVDIILMAYYPINYEAADEGMKATLRIRTNERIREANAAVQALAERKHLRYMDFNAPLTDEQGRLKAEYTIEGMHIHEAGYRAIWPMVRDAVLS